MDFSLPLSALARRTDALALQVLATAGEPLTGRQVARLAGDSTPSNIRHALLRLVDIGLVISSPRHDAVLYSANREHLVWPAVQSMIEAREQLEARIRALTERHASYGTTVLMYGSVARGDADAESDVDLLVVQSPTALNREGFLDYLRADVRKWTGNRAQIFDATPADVYRMWQDKDPLVDAWLVDGRHLAGFPLESHMMAAS